MIRLWRERGGSAGYAYVLFTAFAFVLLLLLVMAISPLVIRMIMIFIRGY